MVSGVWNGIIKWNRPTVDASLPCLSFLPHLIVLECKIVPGLNPTCQKQKKGMEEIEAIHKERKNCGGHHMNKRIGPLASPSHGWAGPLVNQLN